MEPLNDTLFYTLEKTVKSYRQLVQRSLAQAGIDVTLDQWLLLKALQEQPDATQQQIALVVFKDVASVTRMIELLVKKNYIVRSFNVNDRRRQLLSLTPDANGLLERIQPISMANRAAALDGIGKEQQQTLVSLLSSIIQNVS